MATMHFLATVEFDSDRGLDGLAEEVSRRTGIDVTKDDTGRFDEVPAYVGGDGDLQLTLFGPTDDQEERECVLELSFRTTLLPPEAKSAVPAVFHSLFHDAKANSTGHIDCSGELAETMRLLGFSDCAPVR